MTLCTIPAMAARQNTTNLSCRDAAGIVDQAGAIVLSTGVNTFDRYVSNVSYCGTNEIAVTAYAPTIDKDACFVGYVCGDKNSDLGSVIVQKPSSCKDGAQEPFAVRNSEDKMETVIFTCKAGKWINPSAKAAPVAKKCTDGALSTSFKKVPAGNDKGYEWAPFQTVCQNGRWIANN